MKVLVKGNGRDENTERGSVEGRQQSIGEHHKRKYERTRCCCHI